ncbi:MAG: glycosyltransferase family 4 protein [Anaerolineales bacterium]|nr:glycosyltransferase family 4 protein [Anaerolineales bacterium]
MRVAYVTVHVAPQIMRGGVGKKIKTQMRLWREAGHEVVLFSLTPAEIPFPEERPFLFDAQTNLLKREINRASALRRMLDEIRGYQPDAVYLRFGLYSYPLHCLFKIAPVVLEINSDDRPEYRKRGAFFYWTNRLTRGITFGRSSGFISPSYELAKTLLTKYKKPFRVISNGIDLTCAEALPPPQNPQPILTMVCSPGADWHGVDKIIEFAKIAPDVKINVVGYAENDLNLLIPSNVKLLGFLDQENVKNILAQTDVVLGTLALHRKKMDEASPLKVREALAYEIPIIIAYDDTDLRGIEIDTILRIPNTEENVIENAERIRQFAYAMRGKRVDFASVAARFDQHKKEEMRLQFLEEIAAKK